MGRDCTCVCVCVCVCVCSRLSLVLAEVKKESGESERVCVTNPSILLRSSERYLSNHVEQCVQGGLRGGPGQAVHGPSSSAASASCAAAAAATTSSSSSSSSSASRCAPAAVTQQTSCSSVSASPEGDGVGAVARRSTAEGGGPCCPVCQTRFPADASARYIDNHVERCVSNG
eukprot:Rhum_TRINITY_DN14715_c4_g1::Rhum_TRINITY_DN14715_c4_g1_i1::g.111234::m.111234